MLIDLLQSNNGNIQVVVGLSDLREFAENLIHQTLEKQPEKKDEVYLSAKQAAERIGIDRSGLWRWAQKGYLVPVRVGGRPKYKESDIVKLMEGDRK